MTIQETSAELIADFSVFDNWEERYGYLIELGRVLGPMDEALKTESSRVKGCISQVWLVARPAPHDPQRVELIADSDAHIVRGIVAILLKLYSGRTPDEIGSLDAFNVFREIGLSEQLTPNRRSGLVAMVERIQQLAQLHAEHSI